MVYESDYYTSRRPYSRPTVSSYSVTRREVPWEKVPYVPRPSLIPDPITAFGKRKPKIQERKSVIEIIKREIIKPDVTVAHTPIKPYISPREITRNKVLDEVHRNANLRDFGKEAGISADRHNMDIVLTHKHRSVPTRQNHRRVFFITDPTYITYRRDYK